MVQSKIWIVPCDPEVFGIIPLQKNHNYSVKPWMSTVMQKQLWRMILGYLQSEYNPVCRKEQKNTLEWPMETTFWVFKQPHRNVGKINLRNWNAELDSKINFFQKCKEGKIWGNDICRLGCYRKLTLLLSLFLYFYLFLSVSVCLSLSLALFFVSPFLSVSISVFFCSFMLTLQTLKYQSVCFSLIE